jgi:hypothetical protein
MNERYLSMCLGGAKQQRSREVVDTLYKIWTRTLYLEP